MQRFNLIVLIASTALIAVAYASAFIAGGAPWGAWCMVAGVAGISVSVMALGAHREGRRNTLVTGALLATGASLVAGLSLALLLPDTGSAERVVLGFPVRASSVIYLIGVLPLFVLPVVYAWTFDALTLRDEDVARVRRAADKTR
jgi:hypothetical protein